MLNKQKVQQFRNDFQKAVEQLEEQYGMNIRLGTIRFDVNGLSSKMTAEKGEKIVRATKDDFKVGDMVTINHKKVNPNDEFEVIKINAKNVKVKGPQGLFSVTPSLLVKK